MNILSGLYGRAASWRRTWYDRADRRRRLDRPVISVGNLVVGGSGKTPTAATLARLLQRLGERPAILSRGYARRESPAGVVVVSDGTRVLEPVERSGDEPQMLARALPGVPVLVSADRHLAGRLAERVFDVSCHILDDGFQHLPLWRDVDLLIVSPDDLDERVLPGGRLREPLRAARYADAVLVRGDDAAVSSVAERLGCGTSFRVDIRYGTLPPGVSRVVAVAAIARPQRFFDALRAQGYDVVRELAFRDHHWFSARDVEAAERAAAETGADAIVTTEKDRPRVDAAERADVKSASTPSAVWTSLPMTIAIEPEALFAGWLTARLQAARASRGAAA